VVAEQSVPSATDSAEVTGSAGLSVTEIYASIQGESTHAGRPCSFVRLARCPLRCTWCDTVYSFATGEAMSIADVVAKVVELGVPLVEITGGEPLAQKACGPLVAALCDAGHELLMETSGAFSWAEIDPRCKIIADLKCPGSGESDRNLLPALQQLRAVDELKIVVADRQDFDWALAVLAEQLAGLAATILWSPVHPSCRPHELAAWIMQTRAPGRLQLQLHKVLWPEAEAGV
jgi:7-carboxy-7-deazaguanine synthase